ncbi:hypothetical protein [Maridesulfovibrio zosterae]|uniref:hypothetical protein n=1 Tax=Maridesulfovibrio zosterae TaxID=82171 RepID=UPI0004230E92|nr:hypothetical protein [Maridesulfovibrio zosterae]
MKTLRIIVLAASVTLIAGICFAGPMQMDGDITIASENEATVTSVAGGSVKLAGGMAGGQIGNVKNTRTNVGGVNIKNANVGKSATIMVKSKNKGTYTNVGTDLNVGGLNIDGK